METWNNPFVTLPEDDVLVLCYTPKEPINHFIIGAYDSGVGVFIDNDDYGFWPEYWMSIPDVPIIFDNSAIL